MTSGITIKPLGCILLIGLTACAKVVSPPPVPAAPVAVTETEPKPIAQVPKIVKTASELEAESYTLGDHWWVEKRSIDDNKSTASRDRWINKLSSQRESKPKSVGPAPKNVVELANNLRSAAGHESYYWVNETYGDQQSSNVVVLVPQYHRATGLPVLWSSMGQEVALVQKNLKYLVEDLVLSQGLQCLGVEGSSAARVRRSAGLDRSVNWAQRLHDLFQRILYEAAVEDSRLVPAAQTILEGLEPYFTRYVEWQDGVGAAVASLGNESTAFHRFGIEDQELVARAEQLHGKLRELKEKQMVSQKADRGERAIRDMWLAEFPDFRDGFLFPMEESFGELRRASISLRRDGATDEARLVADFLGQVRVLMDQVVSAKEVERYHTYYRDEFGKRIGKTKAKAKESNQKKLKRRIAKLEKQYKRVVMKSRERVAASKVLEVLKKPDTRSCGVVMGAGHEQGLIKALLKQSKDLGIVVVRPYNH